MEHPHCCQVYIERFQASREFGLMIVYINNQVGNMLHANFKQLVYFFRD